MSVTRINEFKSAPGCSDELFAFLKELKSYLISSTGCESCDVLQRNDDDSEFIVIEEWVSETAHQESIASYPLEKMAAAMPLIGAAPKGDYYHR